MSLGWSPCSRLVQTFHASTDSGPGGRGPCTARLPSPYRASMLTCLGIRCATCSPCRSVSRACSAGRRLAGCRPSICPNWRPLRAHRRAPRPLSATDVRIDFDGARSPSTASGRRHELLPRALPPARTRPGPFLPRVPLRAPVAADAITADLRRRADRSSCRSRRTAVAVG